MPDGSREDRYTRDPSRLQEVLTPEQIAALNAARSPSERVRDGAVCGARLTAKAIENKKKRYPDGSFPPYCTLPAGSGTPHPGIGYCKYHGGNTSAGLKNAARTYGEALVEAQKQEIIDVATRLRLHQQLQAHLESSDRFGGNRLLTEITPEEALLEEVRRSVAMVRWLEERIGQWNFRGDLTPSPRSPSHPDNPNYTPQFPSPHSDPDDPATEHFTRPVRTAPNALSEHHAKFTGTDNPDSAKYHEPDKYGVTPGEVRFTPPDPTADASLDKLPSAPNSGLYRPGVEALGGLPALMAETSRGAQTFTDEREWLLLYRAEREHAVKVAKMAIDAGIAERMVSIAEDQGRMLALAVRQVLDALSLTPQQVQLVPKVVPAILRSVSANTPLPQLPTIPGSTNPYAESFAD